jgi:hypothetical protein
MAPRTLNLPHLDAAENVFFQRQLEFIEPMLFEKAYAERKARQFVAAGGLIPDGLETYTYRAMDRSGQAKLIANAADDLPMANVYGTETSVSMRDYGMAYGYSLSELKAAAAARGGQGLSIDAMRARAARDALADKLDSIVAAGDSTGGLEGLLGITGAHDVTSDVTGAWSVGTPVQATILADLNIIVNKAANASNDVESCKRLILPSILYRYLQSTPRSSTSDTTLLKYFQDTHPGVEVMDWERSNTAGASSKHRIVAYDPSPTKVRLLMAVELEQLAPQQENFSFKVNMRMRTGGVIAYYPKSVVYGDITTAA